MLTEHQVSRPNTHVVFFWQISHLQNNRTKLILIPRNMHKILAQGQSQSGGQSQRPKVVGGVNPSQSRVGGGWSMEPVLENHRNFHHTQCSLALWRRFDSQFAQIRGNIFETALTLGGGGILTNFWDTLVQILAHLAPGGAGAMDRIDNIISGASTVGSYRFVA